MTSPSRAAWTAVPTGMAMSMAWRLDLVDVRHRIRRGLGDEELPRLGKGRAVRHRRPVPCARLADDVAELEPHLRRGHRGLEFEQHRLRARGHDQPRAARAALSLRAHRELDGAAAFVDGHQCDAGRRRPRHDGHFRRGHRPGVNEHVLGNAPVGRRSVRVHPLPVCIAVAIGGPGSGDPCTGPAPGPGRPETGG